MQDMKRCHLDKGGLASAAIANKDQLEGRHVFASCHLGASPWLVAALQCKDRLLRGIIFHQLHQVIATDKK